MELSLIHILNRTDFFFYKTEHTITSQNKKRYCYYSLPRAKIQQFFQLPLFSPRFLLSSSSGS